VAFGSDSSTANQSFTAVADDTPVTPPVTPPSSGGGGGGGGGGSSPIPVVTQTQAYAGVSDFNNDGKINSVDFSIMLAFWKTPYPFANTSVDVNNDRQVNSVDFSILLYQWGKNPALFRRE
jgi:hypothetical protein